MWQRIALGALMLVVAYTVAQNLPDVARYMKMRSM